MRAADVEAFVLAEAAKIAVKFPRQNVHLTVGGSRWPFEPPSKDRKWVRWTVTIGTDSVGSGRTIAAAVRNARKTRRT